MMENRQIDRLVAVHVFNWKEWTFINPGRDGTPAFEYTTLVPPEYDGELGYEVGLPYYSTEIAVAWQVLGKMAESWPEVNICKGPWTKNPGYYECVFERTLDDKVIAEGKTAPLAICLAALKAAGIEVEESR